MSGPVQKMPVSPFALPARATAESRAAPEGRGFDAELHQAASRKKAGEGLDPASRDPGDVRAFSDLSFSARAFSQNAPTQEAQEPGAADAVGHPDAPDKAAARSGIAGHNEHGEAGPSPGRASGQGPKKTAMAGPAHRQEPGRGAERQVPALPAGMKQGQATGMIESNEKIARPSAPAPLARPGAAGGQLQGHLVSLLPGAEGLDVRIRTSVRDDGDRRRIESEVAEWLASRGVRIATLRVDGAVCQEDEKGGGR